MFQTQTPFFPKVTLSPFPFLHRFLLLKHSYPFTPIKPSYYSTDEKPRLLPPKRERGHFRSSCCTWCGRGGRAFLVRTLQWGRSTAQPRQWMHRHRRVVCGFPLSAKPRCFLGPVGLFDPRSNHSPRHFAPRAYPFRIWVGYRLGLERMGR